MPQPHDLRHFYESTCRFLDAAQHTTYSHASMSSFIRVACGLLSNRYSTRVLGVPPFMDGQSLRRLQHFMQKHVGCLYREDLHKGRNRTCAALSLIFRLEHVYWRGKHGSYQGSCYRYKACAGFRHADRQVPGLAIHLVHIRISIHAGMYISPELKG